MGRVSLHEHPHISIVIVVVVAIIIITFLFVGVPLLLHGHTSIVCVADADPQMRSRSLSGDIKIVDHRLIHVIIPAAIVKVGVLVPPIGVSARELVSLHCVRQSDSGVVEARKEQGWCLALSVRCSVVGSGNKKKIRDPCHVFVLTRDEFVSLSHS